MSDALTDQDIADIRSTVAPWTQLAVDRNWDTLLTMCTEDVTFLPPGESMVQGVDAVLAFLGRYPEIKEFDVSFTDIDGRGDFATGRGSFTMTVVVEGTEANHTGKFIDTFRKQADGTWLYREVIWNRDQP